MAPTRKRKGRTVLAFNHAMVYVQNVRRALRFYRDQLGFVQIAQFAHQGMPVYARLKSPAGTASIALHQFDPGMTPAGSADIRLYFETPKLEALCRRLQAAGVKFKQMPQRMPWGWRHAYLYDPDGHEISLYWAGKKRLQKD